MGFVGLALSILSFQQNKHRRIIVLQLLAGVTFALHFTLLGAYTGAAMNTVDIIRSVVFVNRGKPWADHIWWVFIFCGLCILSCILTWTGLISLLPMIGMCFTTVSFFLQNPKWVRRISLPASPLWIIYNAISKSYAGVMTELFIVSSIIVAMFRYDFRSFDLKKRKYFKEDKYVN